MKKSNLKAYVAIVQKGEKIFTFPFKSLDSSNVEVKLSYDNVNFDKILSVHTKDEYELIRLNAIFQKRSDGMLI